MRWWRRANISGLRPKVMSYIVHRYRGLACPPWSFRECISYSLEIDWRILIVCALTAIPSLNREKERTWEIKQLYRGIGTNKGRKRQFIAFLIGRQRCCVFTVRYICRVEIYTIGKLPTLRLNVFSLVLVSLRYIFWLQL